MAPLVGWGIGSSRRAGDTWAFTIAHSDFPNSEGWTLQIEVKGASALQWDSDYAVYTTEWTVTIPATVTENLTAGRYEYAFRYLGTGTYDGQEYTAETGVLNVL